MGKQKKSSSVAVVETVNETKTKEEIMSKATVKATTEVKKPYVPAKWEVDFGSFDEPKGVRLTGSFNVTKHWDKERQHIYLRFETEGKTFKVFPTPTGAAVRMTKARDKGASNVSFTDCEC